MSTRDLLRLSLFLQTGMTVWVLLTFVLRKAHRIYPHLGLLLGAEALAVSVTLALLFFRKALHLGLDFAYLAYFWTTWLSCGTFLVLRILIVYSVFTEAMRPMSGLHQAGKIVFRWVGVVSALVALALVAGPGVFSSVESWLSILSRLQQGVSVLTLCLLVFVCFAVRPLGLTFRSHLFGVSLGLGIAASVELLQAAWQVTRQATSVFSSVYIFSSIGFCVALAVWGVYFTLPEPERKMILLPTTSPFFFWNRISEILGDAPGHVAVAGFTPSMLAPAEIEMLTAATSTESDRLNGEGANERMQEYLPRPDVGARQSQPSLAA